MRIARLDDLSQDVKPGEAGELSHGAANRGGDAGFKRRVGVGGERGVFFLGSIIALLGPPKKPGRAMVG